jgi:hypothetical protein
MGEYLRTSRPNLILSAGNSVGMFSLILTRLFCNWKTRVFIKITNPVLRPYNGTCRDFFRRLWYTPIFRFCDGVLTLTNAQTRRLRENFPYIKDMVVTVSNRYIAVEDIPDPEREYTRSPKEPKLIIAIGRLQK